MQDDCKVSSSQPNPQDDRVVTLRRRVLLEEDDEDYRYRMLANFIGMALI
jgi:hypothetical protein